METINELQEVLEKTREQGNGITLQQVGLIITRVYDPAEVRALIRELEYFNASRKEE